MAVFRKQPEISAFEEGQQEAERFIPIISEEYAERGFQSPEAAIEHYGKLAYDFLQEREAVDAEHGQLLRGYLSRFD